MLLDDDHVEEEYYIEIAYRTIDRSFYSVKINENLLNSYGINN
jgi:hypothetical protein